MLRQVCNAFPDLENNWLLDSVQILVNSQISELLKGWSISKL